MDHGNTLWFLESTVKSRDRKHTINITNTYYTPTHPSWVHTRARAKVYRSLLYVPHHRVLHLLSEKFYRHRVWQNLILFIVTVVLPCARCRSFELRGYDEPLCSQLSKHIKCHCRLNPILALTVECRFRALCFVCIRKHTHAHNHARRQPRITDAVKTAVAKVAEEPFNLHFSLTLTSSLYNARLTRRCLNCWRSPEIHCPRRPPSACDLHIIRYGCL